MRGPEVLSPVSVPAVEECRDEEIKSQFPDGIGEQNQFAGAFEDSHLSAGAGQVTLQLNHLVTPAGMGETSTCRWRSKAWIKMAPLVEHPQFLEKRPELYPYSRT
jgi:hypothetical protein